jgi:hypothetical protein
MSVNTGVGSSIHQVWTNQNQIDFLKNTPILKGSAVLPRTTVDAIQVVSAQVNPAR